MLSQADGFAVDGGGLVHSGVGCMIGAIDLLRSTAEPSAWEGMVWREGVSSWLGIGIGGW